MHPTTIAVDLAKSVFQVSIANRHNKIIDRKRLTRSQFERFIALQPPTEIIMEACATANYWSQYAQAHGHQATQLHPFYVKPYVRRNKTDAADADALIRARQDPHLLPVATKQPDQQALQILHRVRQQLIRSRTSRVNLARATLAEFGVPLTRGTGGITARLHAQVDHLPEMLHASFLDGIDDIRQLRNRVNEIDQSLARIAKADQTAQHLLSVPGVGVTTATALIAAVPDITVFNRARQFSAWLGITPREHSSGTKRKLGAISKQGDTYLRVLLIHGARSALQQAYRQLAKDPEALSELQRWTLQIDANRHRNVATVALANKMARLIWVCWTQQRDYLA